MFRCFRFCAENKKRGRCFQINRLAVHSLEIANDSFKILLYADFACGSLSLVSVPYMKKQFKWEERETQTKSCHLLKEKGDVINVFLLQVEINTLTASRSCVQSLDWLSVWSMGAVPVLLWVSSWYVGFLLHSESTHYTFIADSNLALFCECVCPAVCWFLPHV